MPEMEKLNCGLVKHSFSSGISYLNTNKHLSFSYAVKIPKMNTGEFDIAWDFRLEKKSFSCFSPP